jgi:ribosomal protein S19E (S16A)
MVVGITALRLRVLIRIGRLTSGEEKWAHMGDLYGHFTQKWTFIERAVVEMQQGGFIKKSDQEVALSKKGRELYDELWSAMSAQPRTVRSPRSILRGE